MISVSDATQNVGSEYGLQSNIDVESFKYHFFNGETIAKTGFYQTKSVLISFKCWKHDCSRVEKTFL